MTGPLPHRRVRRLLGAGLALATASSLVGCTGGHRNAFFQDQNVPSGSFQLVAFDSCEAALTGLRSAAKAVVGPYGFAYGGWAIDGMGRDMAGAPVPSMAGEKASAGGTSSNGSAPNYSGTNTHESGVDEPDLVKTDGRRIVTVSRGVLRVVDAASRTQAGQLGLATQDAAAYAYVPADLLLAGDHALVLMQSRLMYRGGIAGGIAEDAASPQPVAGPRLMLVDLSGSPRVLGEYTIEGSLVDARQVGGVARVVVRSAPRLVFPYVEGRTDPQRITDNKKIIDRATVDEWLPRFQVTNGGRTETGRVDCASVHRPATYTGASMLTVLTFDLTASRIGRGDGVTIVADGDTVYSNGSSLYVASDQRWRAMPMPAERVAPGIAPVKPAEATTEIYRFTTEQGERPRFAGGGSVPGYIINQYALSEWDGKLRVATTTADPWTGGQQKQESGVYVLAQQKRALKVVGHVGGLGKGERIYAVRFTGPIGYVVTFRQMDPLYTLDLSNPTRPAVIGELKISGYSAYLHPADGTKLIGVGQEASSQGRALGTQVSLFDVADPAHPRRLSQYHVSSAHSTAEFDPHAFLYWPSTGLIVVPLERWDQSGQLSVALVLRVDGDRIDEVGIVSHPQMRDPGDPGSIIQRSLMIDDVLWTVSEGGLMATDPASLGRLAWLPFS